MTFPGSDICDASAGCGICYDSGGETYGEKHWSSSLGRRLGRHGGRHRVDAGPRHQPPLLLPEQRGAGCCEKPLEEMDDGKDGWEEPGHESGQFGNKRHLHKPSRFCRSKGTTKAKVVCHTSNVMASQSSLQKQHFKLEFGTKTDPDDDLKILAIYVFAYMLV